MAILNDTLVRGALRVIADANIGGNVQAATFNGLPLSGSVGANTIPIRDGNGYVYFNYINTNVGQENPNSYNDVSLLFTGSDGWIRKSSLSNAKSAMGINFAGTYFESGNSGNGVHDANSITYNAHDYYQSNGPSTSIGASTGDGALYSQAYSSDWVAQIAQDYRNGRLFVRGKNSGSWTDWKRIAQYDELPTESTVSGWGFTKNAGTVIGSGLTADYIVLGNGTVNVKISSYKPASSSVTWGETNNTYLPTMAAVSSYVLGKGYGNNQKVKAGSVTFDANDVVNFEGSGIITVTGDATNDKITISASHQSIKTLDTTATTAQSTNSNEAIAGSGKITLHKVSKTGSYSDLNDKPTIPATNVIPAIGGVGKGNHVLLSTEVAGTAYWSNWSTTGFLMTDSQGIVSPSDKIQLDSFGGLYLSSLNIGAPGAIGTSYIREELPSGQLPKDQIYYLPYMASADGGVLATQYWVGQQGYTTNAGTVTSVRVQAGTGLASSQNTAQSGTLDTTISIASGYKLPTTTEWNNKSNKIYRHNISIEVIDEGFYYTFSYISSSSTQVTTSLHLYNLIANNQTISTSVKYKYGIGGMAYDENNDMQYPLLAVGVYRPTLRSSKICFSILPDDWTHWVLEYAVEDNNLRITDDLEPISNTML